MFRRFSITLILVVAIGFATLANAAHNRCLAVSGGGGALARAVANGNGAAALAATDSLPSKAGQEKYFIGEITVRGNKRTKKHIIMRELSIAPGDVLEKERMEEVLEQNRNQVYNTRLFNEVKVKISKLQPPVVDLVIEVEERWYIFPAIIFELTDDNFNRWWKGDGKEIKARDFRRTEYGVRFKHDNFRGRREILKTTILFGYTKKFELSYQLPFIDKSRKTGISFGVSYIINKEVPYLTANNRQLQYKETGNHPDFIRKRFRAELILSRRPDIQSLHSLNLSYFNNTVSDSVAVLNPDFFLDGRTRQQYIYLSYIYTRDYRDIKAYPLKGYYFRLHATQEGLGIFKDHAMFRLIGNFTQYFPIARNFSGLLNVRVQMSLPRRQPYFNVSALGKGNAYVRGYERYTVDGQDFGLFRSALKYKILDFKFTNPLVKWAQFRTIPLALYLKGLAEAGYAADVYRTENNPLSNEWMYSFGAGVDLVTLYDMVVGFEAVHNAHPTNFVDGHKPWSFFISVGLLYDFD